MNTALLILVVLQNAVLSVVVLVALAFSWQEWNREQARRQAERTKQQEIEKLVGQTWQTGGQFARDLEKQMAADDQTKHWQGRYAP